MDAVKTIIGMATLSTVSAVIQYVISVVKGEDSKIIDFVSKCLLVTTGAAAFITLIKTIETIVL